MKFNPNIYVVFILVIFLFSCNPDPSDDMVTEPETTFGNFEITTNNSASLLGAITESTAADLTALIETYPNTSRIVMGDVNGATSHEAAFSAARIVRANNLDIHISDNSTIRKEAVNFLLGGIKRTKGDNVQLGVSAWINDQGLEATDFDFGHEAHLPWINFYVEMGYQFQLATDFYYFSVFAAPSDDIFFLTDDQVNTYDLIN